MNDDPPEMRRKRPLSDNPAAVHSRRYRERVKQGVTMALVPVGEKDFDRLDRAGHLDERLDKRAAAAALRSLLDAWPE